jgi:hypothetical protein
MTNNLKWILIALAVLVGLYFVNLVVQKRYTTSSDLVFPKDQDRIAEITIKKGTEELALVKAGDTWSIADHDSLVIREFRLKNLLEKVLPIKRETLVSRNEAKWNKYSVDDSTGTHVLCYDDDGELLVHAIFGRSKSDWSHNYVRVEGSPNVYLTDANIIYHLNTKATFWGEKPKPVEPDTTATVSDTTAVAEPAENE